MGIIINNIFDESDVRTFYKWLGHRTNEFTEVRIIDPKKEEKTIQTWVNNEEDFVNIMKEYSGKKQCYVGLNPRKKRGGLTEDVSRVTCFLFDVDSKHPKDQPATDEELKAVKSRLDELLDILKTLGLKEPLVSMSGNGYHVIQKVDIDIDDNTPKQLETYHRKIAPDLDSMFDLPRIVKVPGTLSVKGTASKERPYRLATIVSIEKNPRVDKKLSAMICGLRIAEKKPLSGKANISDIQERLDALRKKNSKLDLLLNVGVPSQYPSASEADMATIGILHNAGFEDFEAVSVLKMYRARDKLERDDYIQRIVDRVYSDEPTVHQKNESTQKQKKNEVTEQILEVLGNKYVFKTPTDTEELHLYKDGVYIEARATIKGEIENILKHSATIGFCNEIIDHFRRRSYVDREEFNNITDYLPLMNGLLNLKTLKLEPHNLDNIFTFKIPTTYAPDAKCPKFLKTFDEIIIDNDDRLLLQEYAGYSLLSSFPHHQLLFLIGKGRNGKGVYIRTIEGIIGKNNVSNVRLEEFNGGRRFVLARLYGKLMNICSEPRTRFELETELLKMVTGDDSIDAELKNIQKPLKFTSFAKFFVQANRLPRVADNTDSFWERVLIVKFSQKFTDALGNRIANIEKTWLGDEEERSGVLNWMLAGLKRLMDNQRFTVSKSMKEQKTLFKQLSDTIGAFLEDESAVRYGPILFVKTEDLYNAYKAYVENIGGVVESIRALNAQVRMTPNILEGGKREGKKVVRIWKGIDIIIKTETDKDQQLLDNTIEDQQPIDTAVEPIEKHERKQPEKKEPDIEKEQKTSIDDSTREILEFLATKETYKFEIDINDTKWALYSKAIDRGFVEKVSAHTFCLTEKGLARIKELKEQLE